MNRKREEYEDKDEEKGRRQEKKINKNNKPH